MIRHKRNKNQENSQFNSDLFLGFFVGKELQTKLDRLNPELIALFFQEDDSFLKEFFFNGRLFLGKYLGEMTDLPSIEQTSLNIYSLLKKLVPEYPFQSMGLLLIPTIKN